MIKDPQPIGTFVIVLNPQGQVLLGKRKNSYKSGFYGFPGGRIELGEPVIEAARREVTEETGMKLSELQFAGVIRENQGEYDFIHFAYVAQNVEQEPQLCEPSKCEGWSWFDLDSIDSIAQLILPGHLAALTLYKNGEIMVDFADMTATF